MESGIDKKLFVRGRLLNLAKSWLAVSRHSRLSCGGIAGSGRLVRSGVTAGVVCLIALASLLGAGSQVGSARAEVASDAGQMGLDDLSRHRGSALAKSDVEDRPGYTVVPASFVRLFDVPATNGFDLAAYILGNRQAVLEVRSKDARIQYVAHADRKGKKTYARFGRLGSFVMEFVPDGPARVTKEPQGDCRGRRAMVQTGVFRGDLKWRGENGFSSARVRQATGLSIRSFREVCKGSSAAPGVDRESVPSLVAWAKGAGRNIEVQAYFDGATPNLMALVEEPGKQLDIYRWLTEDGSAGEVDFGASATVSVSPAEPFKGEAEFVPGVTGGGEWLGGLIGKFPGVGPIALAGAGFIAELH